MPATERWMRWWETGTILAEMVEDIAESMETVLIIKRLRAICRGPMRLSANHISSSLIGSLISH